MQTPTQLLSEIKAALDSQEYDAAKAKCDAAMKKYKGKDSVPFLVARSTALRSNGQLESALKDAKKAISVDPEDPEGNVVLGQAYLSLAAQAMADGKPKCTDNKQAFTLGRLNAMQSIASQALVGTQSQGRDPLFLPKETFQKILLLLDSKTKVRCTQVNQAWERQLTDDPALWRECEFPNCSDPSLAVFYFNTWSLDTLVSVDLLFKMLDSEELDGILEDLHKSVATLQSLKFKGYLHQTTFTSRAIKLASECRHLKHFDYRVAEDRYLDPEKKQKRIEERRDREENYRDYDSDDMMSDDSEDDYDEMDECDFTDYKFEGFPEIVRLRTSQLTRIYFRETDFFKSVKKLHTRALSD